MAAAGTPPSNPLAVKIASTASAAAMMATPKLTAATAAGRTTDRRENGGGGRGGISMDSGVGPSNLAMRMMGKVIMRRDDTRSVRLFVGASSNLGFVRN